VSSLKTRACNFAQPARVPGCSRCCRGSTLAEVGPALFLLFFFALFPAIDLLGMGISYCSCLSLNDLQLREACRLPKSMAVDPRGQVMLGIPNNWKATVIGGFGATMSDPITDITYVVGKGAIYVNVSTTVTSHPMFQIPFMPGVPGLGDSFSCNISNNRVLENPMYAAQ
jgi:hypothetical protein